MSADAAPDAKGTWLPALWCLGSAALFGASTPACKLLLDEVGPLTLAGLLYLGAAVATAPLALAGGSSERRADPANLRHLGGAIVFGGILGPVALLVGLQSAPAASASLWLNLETTATAVLAWAFFRENLGMRGWVANGLVVVAGVLLASPGGFSVAPSALWIGLACVCWGVDNNFTAVIDGYTPEQTTALKGGVAGSVNLLLAAATGDGLPPTETIMVGMSVGALAYGVSIVLYIRGAQQLGATRSQMLFATAPFLGVAAAWMLLGESVLPVQVGAAVLMVGALYLLLSDRHEHAHTHAAQVHTHAHRHDDGHHDHEHAGLAPEVWHTHEHAHDAVRHSHAHVPDLHHRHGHEAEEHPSDGRL